MSGLVARSDRSEDETTSLTVFVFPSGDYFNKHYLSLLGELFQMLHFG